MWGLYSSGDVPSPPDPILLKEFYDRFSHQEDVAAAVQAVVDDAAALNLVAQDEVLTLRTLRTEGAQLARGMNNIEEFHILYVQGMLAKVGMRVWGPNPRESPDSPYNVACRVTAISSFREMTSSGAYTYMNVKLKYNDSINLLIRAYNHYVHVYMAQKFKAELKEVGSVKKESEKKAAQKGRERVCLLSSL